MSEDAEEVKSGGRPSVAYKNRYIEAWFGWWRVPTDRFAALVAIFTLGLTIATFGLWIATRDLVRDAESSGRAWLAPTGFTFANLNDPDEPLVVNITYVNVGKEPARKVKNNLRTLYVRNPNPAPPSSWAINHPIWKEAPLEPAKLCSAVKTNSTSVIYPAPNVAFSLPITNGEGEDLPRSMLPTLFEEVKSRRTIFIVAGCLEYETIHQTRHMSFCAYLTPNSGDIKTWIFSACPIGNDDF